jgi:hypothetical protein
MEAEEDGEGGEDGKPRETGMMEGIVSSHSPSARAVVEGLEVERLTLAVLPADGGHLQVVTPACRSRCAQWPSIPSERRT